MRSIEKPIALPSLTLTKGAFIAGLATLAWAGFALIGWGLWLVVMVLV